jgi:hypothetical protein
MLVNTQSIACAFCVKIQANLHHADTTSIYQTSPNQKYFANRQTKFVV